MSATYINCKVFPGLFSTEYYIVLNDTGCYVHRDNVRVHELPQAKHEVSGQVLGYVIERQHGKTLVQLPGEAVVGGLRTWVEDTALSAA